MTATTNRKPTHRLYVVKGEGESARWIELGAAWENRDSNGFTLQLDALPTDGRIVMRVITAQTESAGGQS